MGHWLVGSTLDWGRGAFWGWGWPWVGAVGNGLASPTPNWGQGRSHWRLAGIAPDWSRGDRGRSWLGEGPQEDRGGGVPSRVGLARGEGRRQFGQLALPLIRLVHWL